MKVLLHVGATTALTLVLAIFGLAHSYNQTNLVSNTSGVAPVTDPQLVNSSGISRGPRLTKH
jgi:hypothetical protein